MGDAPGGGKADHDLAAAVAHKAAQPGQAHAAPLEDALQLPGGAGQVGGHHHHDAPLIHRGVPQAAHRKPSPQADAVHRQVFQLAVVALHQHPQGVTFAVQQDPPGGRTDAALEPMADGALSGPHIPFVKIQRRIFDGGKNFLFPHGPMADAVDPAVVAFAHHRVQAPHFHAVLFALFQSVFHQGIVHQAHIQGVGQGDGGLQGAQLIHLQKARGLAEAVPDKAGRGHFVREKVPRPGEDHRHAGFVFPVVNGAVAHLNTFHIGDLVPLAPGQAAHCDSIFVDPLLVHCHLPLCCFRLFSSL